MADKKLLLPAPTVPTTATSEPRTALKARFTDYYHLFWNLEEIRTYFALISERVGRVSSSSVSQVASTSRNSIELGLAKSWTWRFYVSHIGICYLVSLTITELSQSGFSFLFTFLSSISSLTRNPRSRRFETVAWIMQVLLSRPVYKNCFDSFESKSWDMLQHSVYDCIELEFQLRLNRYNSTVPA